MLLLKIILLATFLYKSLYAERRIVDGQAISQTKKRYMVYLALTPESPNKYDTWICGGAIIHPKYVLTSAACIEDVQKAYVVAGYDQYVKFSDFKKNKCISKMKRKVISSAIPAAYNFSQRTVNRWLTLDIAVVEVDKPFDYKDEKFNKYCSYPPNEIKVNFDEMNEKPNQNVMTLGWGHTKKLRTVGDSTDLNAKKLIYTSLLIFKKEDCKKFFATTNIDEAIDKHMICTYGKSYLDENGDIDPPVAENIAQVSLRKPVLKRGLCQNDHGGPLVTWVDNEEILLGVASIFDINKKFECQQPNLFTSTALNKHLIECVLKKKKTACKNVKKNNKIYKVIRRQFSWKEDDQ